MIGEIDLQKLLGGMDPTLDEVAFAFATVRSIQDVQASVRIIGSFNEDEGVTIIAPSDQIGPTGLTQSGPFAKISLRIHSSLAAVGLTATIATSLAQAGISANIVAGFFHDHIFVPWDDRQVALHILSGLGTEQA